MRPKVIGMHIPGRQQRDGAAQAARPGRAGTLSTSPRCSKLGGYLKTNRQDPVSDEHEDEQEVALAGRPRYAGTVEAPERRSRDPGRGRPRRADDKRRGPRLYRAVRGTWRRSGQARRVRDNFILEAEPSPTRSSRWRTAIAAQAQRIPGRASRACGQEATKVMKAAGVKALSGATYTISWKDSPGRSLSTTNIGPAEVLPAWKNRRTCWRSNGSPASSDTL